MTPVTLKELAFMMVVVLSAAAIGFGIGWDYALTRQTDSEAIRAPCFSTRFTSDRLPGCVYPLCDSLHCHPPMILRDTTTPPVTR